MKIYKGTYTPDEMDWEVTVNGKDLNPRLDLCNHSPSGLSWGYGGSGPAQLALAMLADCTDDETALKYYQAFKFAVIGRLEMNAPFELSEDDVYAALSLIKERQTD